MVCFWIPGTVGVNYFIEIRSRVIEMFDSVYFVWMMIFKAYTLGKIKLQMIVLELIDTEFLKNEITINSSIKNF